MIRNWLRSWLGIARLDSWSESLQGSESKGAVALARISELEKELADQELVHSQEIQEFRDRLDMPAKRKPSGRPFHVLQKIAEMGEMSQRGR